MKFPSWLDSLRSCPSRRPIRRAKPRGPRQKSAAGKLSVESLECRTVPAFLTPVNYAVGLNPQAVVTGDFNNDTIPDLAVANYDAGTVSVLLGNKDLLTGKGDGTFQAAKDSPAGSNPFSLAVGDFDQKLGDDLAALDADGTVRVLLSKGDGTFQTPTSINLGSSPASVAVGDFNGDGSMDLGVTTNVYYPGYSGYGGWYPGYYTGSANVLLGNGSGSFGSPLTTWLGYGEHTGAAAGDFNGDGRDDFAAVVNDYWLVSVLLADDDGSGKLQNPFGYATGAYPQSVSVGDVNGDKVVDLVTANSGSVSAFLGNSTAEPGGTVVGDGTFQEAKTTNTGFYPASVATGDFNQDGKMDFGAASSDYIIDGYTPGPWGGYYPFGHYEGQAQVLLGYGNGYFAVPQTTELGVGSANYVAGGNFDGNAFTDLAVTRYDTNTGVGSVSVLINNDLPWPDLPPPPVSISDAANVTEGNDGSTNAVFTVSIPFAYDQDVTVHYATANGTGPNPATAGSDYTGTAGDATVTIPKGSTTAEIKVAILGDRSGEPNETFVVNLTPNGVPFADAQGSCTIVDDEPRISISDAPSVTESSIGSVNATFTVTLSAIYDQDVTVHYATANGTGANPATAGSDYTTKSGDVIVKKGDKVGSSRVDLQACKLEYSIVSPK